MQKCAYKFVTHVENRVIFIFQQNQLKVCSFVKHAGVDKMSDSAVQINS